MLPRPLRCRTKVFIRVWKIRKESPRFSKELREEARLSWIRPRKSSNHQICKVMQKKLIVNSLSSIFKGRKISLYWRQLNLKRISTWNYSTKRQRWMMSICNKRARASNNRDRCPQIIILDSNNRKCLNQERHPSQPELTSINSLPWLTMPQLYQLQSQIRL